MNNLTNEIAGRKRQYENYKFETNEPILDIGGGDGSFLKSQDIKKALIVDYKKYDNGFDFLKYNIVNGLPLFTKKFKTIFLMEVLEHLKNPLYILAKCYDILDDNGFLYLAVPYDTNIHIPNHHHICNWTLKNLLEQVDKLGFNAEVIQTRRRFKGIGFWLPHCWIVLKLEKRLINYNNSDVK